MIIDKLDNTDLSKIFIATHTHDSLDKAISMYNFMKIRFVHIEKVRY